MLTHFRKGIFSLLDVNLSLKLWKGFTIKNYMKTYEIQNVERTAAHLNHGIFRVDEYKSFSLNQQSVQQFVNKENEHYEEKRKLWQERTKKYYQQTSIRRDTRTTSAQQQYDDYSYFTSAKFIEDKQYTVIHRRHNITRKEEIVLDIMQYYSLKKHYKTIELVRTAFSKSHRYLAFGYDLNNNQHIRWMVKDTKENRIVGVKGWENNVLEQVNETVFYNDKGLFYTKTQNRRPSKLYYQEFDSEPQLLYEEKDPSFWLYIQLSKDKSHLILSSSSKNHNKTKCINLPSDPSFSFTEKNTKPLMTEISQTSSAQKVQVNHCQDYFVIWREQQTQSTISIKKNNEKLQKIIHTLKPQQTLTDMDVFQNIIVLYIQNNTKPIMRIISTKNNYAIQDLILPHEVGKISPGMNQVYNTQNLQFYISTPFIYNEGYSYDFTTKRFTVTQKFEPTGPKFNHKKYETTTIEVPALDGEKIPLTIIAQKRKVQYPKKLILRVYGFYGLPNEISYDNINCALLENGWTIAFAHVRGGNEKGKKWHRQTMNNKSVIWSDLEDCVGFLVREKYTHPSILFLQSHSAGAIAVWNILNKAPHLFKAVVLNYPFLDVLNTLLDPNDPLSASDHAQFGNPITDKAAFRAIQSISPYENIQNKPYPFVYVIGGKNDYRCPVSQLAKFVKRFRTRAIANNRFSANIAQKGILLKVYDDASHLGTSNVSDENFNNCEIYGFLDYLVYEASNDCKY